MPCSLEDFKMTLQAGGHIWSFRSILDSEHGIIVWFFGIMLVYAILSRATGRHVPRQEGFEKHRGENILCPSHLVLDSEHEEAKGTFWADPPKSHTLKDRSFQEVERRKKHALHA
jgi:hypothetical protein